MSTQKILKHHVFLVHEHIRTVPAADADIRVVAAVEVVSLRIVIAEVVRALHSSQQFSEKPASDTSVMFVDPILVDINVVATKVDSTAPDSHNQSAVMTNADGAFHLIPVQNGFQSFIFSLARNAAFAASNLS